MNNQVYVRAQGKHDELIASYEFQIHVGGEYAVWILSYGTSSRDNDVNFQIDNLDRLDWQTTYIDKGRPMWTQYMYQVRIHIQVRTSLRVWWEIMRVGKSW